MAARSFNYGSGWQNGPLPPADVFIAASDETRAANDPSEAVGFHNHGEALY